MDRLFIRQFGWLFDCYEAKYFWWEVAILCRKAFVVGIANTITDNSYLQLLTLCVFLVVHLFWTFYTQPYVQERHTIVDIWLQIQLLMLLIFALTNIVGNDGMKIIITRTGNANENQRIKILEPEPDMDMIADKNINANVITNLTLIVLVGISALGNFMMVLFDLYESRVHAPKWAPYLFNGIYGCELWEWDEFVSNLLSNFDKLFTKIRDRNKVKPPTRPASRWAHRVMMMEGVAKIEDFSTHESTEAMLAAAVATTQQEEWARDKESCIEYIRSLDKRIFASEMYNSKAANLPILERERNLAKKRLIQFLYDEVGQVFKGLYDQTGLNEQTMWDIAELERLRQEKAIVEVGEQEHKKHLLKEDEEQKRRVGSVAAWKVKYEKEVAQCQVTRSRHPTMASTCVEQHCCFILISPCVLPLTTSMVHDEQELQKQVKQARDALLLYHLEESDDSDDERELDSYLKRRITEYIDSKSVRDLVNEGKLEPQPIFQ
jgi:hypothetical protein